MRIIERFLGRNLTPRAKSRVVLSLMIFFILLLCAPWAALSFEGKPAIILGLPASVFASLIVFPVFLLIGLFRYTRAMQDIERHFPETENE